jgi:ATP-dependent Lon protease
MQPVLLPLFPLQVVLLPGAELPLHIFEDRYKEMMREVIRDRLEFGVVLANEKGIVNTGCTATVDQVLRQYPDGRMDLLTRGRRRFEIVRLNDERAFLRGSVDFFDDDESATAAPEIQKRAIEGYRQLQALSESPSPGSLEPMGHKESPEAKPGSPDAAEAIDQNDPQLSFRLAQPVPDLGFRQTLLATRSEAERLRQLADFLPAYLHRQRRIQHMKEVAPKNGHGAGHMPGHPGGAGHGPSGIE